MSWSCNVQFVFYLSLSLSFLLTSFLMLLLTLFLSFPSTFQLLIFIYMIPTSFSMLPFSPFFFSNVFIPFSTSLFHVFSLSSRVFTQFLLPWLESLPQQLVELGQSNHPLAAFIIDTLASAASYISLSQLEQHLVTLLGMTLLH